MPIHQYYMRYMSDVMRKPAFHKGKNKGAGQLHSNCKADQRLCFHNTDSTMPLLSKSKISNDAAHIGCSRDKSFLMKSGPRTFDSPQ